MIKMLEAGVHAAGEIHARFVTHLPPPGRHDTLYDWQTLLAGVLALVAALIAVAISAGQLGAAKAQLVELERQADRDRGGRLRAARASLPTALSTICAYATTIGRALHGQWPSVAQLYPELVTPAYALTVNVQVPRFPEATLRTLERIVELTDDDSIAERIENILREAQVMDTRIAALHGGESMVLETLIVYIVQAGEIYAQAESLFGYARRERETVDADLWARVSAAMSIFGVHDPEILAFIARAQA